MGTLTLDFSQIQKAKDQLSQILQPTPLLSNPWLSERYNCEVYLKLENMQPIGSFKIRGATYKIMSLSQEERDRGVFAASAGNHAQGVAWGAKRMNAEATIVMPVDAPLMKIQRTRHLGAKVVLEGENFDEAWDAAIRVCDDAGGTFIPSFEDPDIMAGQGTVGIEIADQLPDVDFVLGSIGGGGLMGGVGCALKTLVPKAKIYGCQAAGAAEMVESLEKGEVVRHTRLRTFADGIQVRAKEPMRSILEQFLDGALAADDENIASAVLDLMEVAKVVSEGGGAVPLAVLENIRTEIQGKKVVLIVSGGNIDVNLVSRIIDRGLINEGRRIRVNALIPDQKGSLSQLTQIIAQEGASVIQVIHDRNEPSTRIEETEVLLTLETRGHEHSDRVIAAIRQVALRVETV